MPGQCAWQCHVAPGGRRTEKEFRARGHCPVDVAPWAAAFRGAAPQMCLAGGATTVGDGYMGMVRDAPMVANDSGWWLGMLRVA